MQRRNTAFERLLFGDLLNCDFSSRRWRFSNWMNADNVTATFPWAHCPSPPPPPLLNLPQKLTNLLTVNSISIISKAKHQCSTASKTHHLFIVLSIHRFEYKCLKSIAHADGKGNTKKALYFKGNDDSTISTGDAAYVVISDKCKVSHDRNVFCCSFVVCFKKWVSS